MMPTPQGAPNPTPAPPGPAGAPMAQPTPNDGSTQMAMVQVETAQQMLEQACASLPRDSKQYKAAEKALKDLAKDFPRQRSGDLVNAQIAEMARAQSQAPVAQFMGGAPGSGAQPQQMAPA